MRLRKIMTPLWLVFTVVTFAVAAACLLLGWWQWMRFEEVGGDYQNLGYTIQWPFFAAFAIYLWWRLLRDAVADDQAAAESAGASLEKSAEPSTEKSTEKSTPSSTDSRPVPGSGASTAPDADEDADPELAAYNAYLAELARRHARATGHAKEKP